MYLLKNSKYKETSAIQTCVVKSQLDYKLDGSKQQNLLSHSSASQKFEIKVLAGPCFLWPLRKDFSLPLPASGGPRHLSLGLRLHPSRLCCAHPHMPSPPCLRLSFSVSLVIAFRATEVIQEAGK